MPRKVARPLFNHFQGGTRDSITDFNQLLTSGHIHIIVGSALEITLSKARPTLIYCDSKGQIHKQIADIIVNCAGPGRDNYFDGLTSKMLGVQCISLCPHSGGILGGDHANTPVAGVRYLDPAVNSMGNFSQAVPFYDAYRLRIAVQQFNKH